MGRQGRGDMAESWCFDIKSIRREFEKYGALYKGE
jgi:hypothetical protein